MKNKFSTVVSPDSCLLEKKKKRMYYNCNIRSTNLLKSVLVKLNTESDCYYLSTGMTVEVIYLT